MSSTTRLTGYPSIDKPWLKYYSEDAINAPLPECTMYQYVWQENKDHFSDIALRYYGRRITYGKLFNNIQKATKAFHEMGIRAGDIVTIMSMHTPETIYSIYALNYLGAVANVVYMTLSDQEILDTIRNTESKMLLVLDLALERIKTVKDEIGVPVVLLEVADSMSQHMKLGYGLQNKSCKHDFLCYINFLKHGKESMNLPPMATDHSALAIIVYTSGTTGEPKGVMLNSNCLNSLVLQCRLSGKNYRRGETFLNILPPFIGFGVGMMHLAICVGIESTLWLDLSPEIVVKKFARLKPNRFVIGPAFIDPILNFTEKKLKFLIELTGGGTLSRNKEKELNQFLHSMGSRIKYTQGYGMTEFASVVCMQQNHIYEEGSLGIPLPQANVKIVDPETGKEQQYNEVGEVCFSAPNTMIGYFKNEEATSQVFEVDSSGTHWLHTGDLGYVNNNGFVFYQGRIKRIYLCRDKYGVIYKLFPQRIEELFETCFFIQACAVIVRANLQQLNVPIAFVELKLGAGSTKQQAVEELEELAQKELPEHHRPVAIHVLDAMPLTVSGKIDYRALEKEMETT